MKIQLIRYIKFTVFANIIQNSRPLERTLCMQLLCAHIFIILCHRYLLAFD